VLYLNSQTKQIEKYDGNYNDVLEDIQLQVEKEKRKNAQMSKEIQANKDKANFFAHKGGNMRMVAKRMREKVDAYEDNKVDVRKEDKTIRNFSIPTQDGVPIEVMKLTEYTVVRDHAPKQVKKEIILRRGEHMHMIGPNGIGKTTLLESFALGNAVGEEIAKGTIIGYYRQDFSNLDFNQSVYECLINAMKKQDEEEMRSLAAGFLLYGPVMSAKIGTLSEGQKGLVAFARLALMKPGLLILDEPTNHINFRHIPIIAKAISEYKGAMILVSHVPEFVSQIRIDTVFDLGKK